MARNKAIAEEELFEEQEPTTTPEDAIAEAEQQELAGMDLNEDTPDSELISDLLATTVDGEELRDPRCGKYDEAVLVDAVLVQTNDNYRVDLKWGGTLVDGTGNPFDMSDRLFFPVEDTNVFVKNRFMQKLKVLGVVPQKYDKMLYANDPVNAPKVLRLIKRKLGSTFPITIKQDDRGFVNVDVRHPKKQPAA